MMHECRREGPERSAGMVPERSAGIVPERLAGMVPERSAGMVPERSAGMGPVMVTERSAGMVPAGMVPERSAGMIPERSAGTGLLTTESLRELAQQKEQEWKEVQQLRVQSLEAALQDKETLLQEEKAKFAKLKEDFKYNLKLLNDRHAELDTYDSVLVELKTTLAGKDAETSELKIKIDELQSAAARQVSTQDELQKHYQQRIREKHAQIDTYRAEKDSEIQKERDELESFKRNMERQLRETEEEMDVQRRELTAGFEEALKKREHEYRLQADHMSSVVLSHQLKEKLLSKEMESIKAAQHKEDKEKEKVHKSQRELEKQLKQTEWQLQDTAAMKDARISELEGQLAHSEQSMKRMQEDFQRKHSEMDRFMREKDSAVAKVREGAAEREHQLQEKLQDTQSHLEDTELKLRQSEWSSKDTARDKEATIEKLQIELSDLQLRWDSHLNEASQGSVAKDLEIEALQADASKLKTDLANRKDDIERYKKELAEAVERHSALERTKAQLDLDWQRRYEDTERVQYERSEDLVKTLTRARDEALADVKKKDRELSQREDLISVLTEDRDRALATLRQHGIKVDHSLQVDVLEKVPESASEQMQELQQQNDNLRQVIQHMRKEMEELGEQIPQSARLSHQDKHPVVNEYVKNLEQELHKYKTRVRQLEQQTKDAAQHAVPPGEENVQNIAGDSTLVKAHIESLNSAIGSLRSEKVELLAAVRKQQSRLHHLEATIEAAEKEPREQLVQLEQLQYELGAQDRRYKAQIASMKQSIASLEQQLEEARREADEYYKANIENTMHTTALGNQISGLKLDLAQKRQPINFGAQELVIQQLEDEIERLRKQQKGGDLMDVTQMHSGKGLDVGGSTSGAVSQLHAKLKQAARHISQLAKEKQQLIEVGNRLRAELKKHGIEALSGPRHRAPPGGPPIRIKSQPLYAKDDLDEKVQNKLNQLEKLQYELTKQQLAQKTTEALGMGDRRIASTMESTMDRTLPEREEEPQTDEEDEYRPKSILKQSSKDMDASSPPDDQTQVPRPLTAPVIPPRPTTAESDTFRPRPSTSQADSAPQRSSGDQLRLSGGHPLRTSGGMLMSMSSVGGESLADIWRMLDEEGISPRPFTPAVIEEEADPGDSRQSSSTSDGLTIKGRNAPAVTTRGHSAPAVTTRGHSVPAVKGHSAPVVTKGPKQTTTATYKQPKKKIPPKKQVRNYNIREDSLAR